MEEKIINKLKQMNQEHILKLLENNIQLQEQLRKINLDQTEELYESTKIKKEVENKKIESVKYTEKEKIDEQEYKTLKQIGEDIITQNKYAVVTMAGGQGTRLGHTGPKGTYKIDVVTGEKYLFEILVDSLKKANNQYNVIIPWYIMTSRDNHKQTVDFLEEHKYFGYDKTQVKLFIQGELPLINEEGKLLIDQNNLIKEASDGNGGVYEAMYKNGILEDMKNRGISWVFIGGIDNILLNIADPVFIGLTIKQQNLIASKSVVKANPKEKVGVFCKINGKPKIIEYIELPEEMANETDENGNLVYGDVNILNHLFNIKVLENLGDVKLPYHIAFKKIGFVNENGEYIEPEQPNAYKFETFIFDAFERYNNMTLLRVKREDEFAPIKNAEGADSPETAKKLYNNKIRKGDK